MKASVVDLRYRMNEVLRAIERNEEVTILYHGRVKGVIKPRTSGERRRISDHPFFNMLSSRKGVKEELADLRGGRYHAL